MQQGLAALRVVDLSTGIPGGYCARLLADAGADVVKVEPPGGDPWRAWSAGGAAGRRRRRRRAVPVPPPRHALGGRPSGRPGGRGARRRRRRRDRELRAVGVRPAALARRASGPRSCARSRRTGAPGPYAERPTTEFIVQAESGGLVGRGSVRSVPFQAGGRTSEWLAGTFSGDGGRGGRAARGSDSGHGEHIDFSIAEVMTIAASSYARVHPRAASAARRSSARRARSRRRRSSRPSTATSASAPTAASSSTASCCSSSAPDLIDDDPVEHRRQTGRSGWDEWNEIVHAWTTQHTTAEIVRLASELRIPVAPVHGGENILECDHFVARDVFVDDADGHVQDAAPPVAHGRRGPAAAAPGAAPRRAHRRDRAAHAGARRRSPATTPTLPLGGRAGARPHRVVGRPDRRRRDSPRSAPT